MGEPFDKNRPSTDGIKINNWQPECFDGKLRFWDFGGQEIMHSMHRCFLTERCVYVVVLNGRENDFIDRKALHWLDTVQSFAPGSPIIIAINKSDRMPYTSIAINSLSSKFPNVIYNNKFINTSADTGLGVQELMDSIVDCVSNSDGYQHYFNKNMMEVKDNIEAIKDFYIQNDEYVKLCHAAGIDSPKIQIDLLKWFKDLGVSFYYKDKPGKEARPSMEEYTVLKPEWLTNGIYRLINRAGEDNGRISHRDIHKILDTIY